MNSAERNYSAPEKECLAVVWAILHLRPYLEWTRFTVRSDQVALRWLLSLKHPSVWLEQWRLRLAEFYFEIQDLELRTMSLMDEVGYPRRAETRLPWMTTYLSSWYLTPPPRCRLLS
jgi:RNase H-like domain found in reverse transcriptase